MNRLLFLCALCISVVPLSAASSARQAIERAIPFIEEQGVEWIEKRNCVSCHRINTMVWSLNLAREKGFVVSEELDEWIDWSITASFSKNDKGKIVGQLNKEGVAQLLLGLPQLPKAKRAKLAALLPHAQREDGTWKPGGQLPGQKRPAAETSVVTAQWLALALADGPVAVRARKAAGSSPAGQSTEYYALKLLLAETFKTRAGAQQALLQHQRADGGWGWLTQDPSDALGTGLALYALQRAGLSPEAKAAVRARAFLLRTQSKDGSWPVRGTKANKKKSVEETATYWGTTWAVIALATGLPAKGE
ncbi:MAG: hypothetical protein H8E27_05440 [Verrucomicrobia subdivision 3 bacterium]|nr:hypothetical protein [Limisphaerales bacterium]